jgi:predicted ATPase
VSDGTILTLAFLILRFQKPAPELLLIEEPERGLHPFLLEQLVALARGLSTAAFGGDPIQVIMATHSAELLEHLEPDEVRFLKRVPEDGSTRVEAAPTESPDWERAFEEYAHSLGNAWLSGGLGGVPGAA